MARLFPQLSACRFDTEGERRLAERLYRKLEDDYLVWCNVPVGPLAQQPDFVLLHPRRGILVLEVKDWQVSTVHAMDRQSAQIHTGSHIKQVANPLAQARTYAMAVNTLLERDPALQQAANSPYAGRLIMPYGWGAVLTRVTRKQFNDAGWHEIMEADRVICSDEMTENIPAEAFQQRLWDMFIHVFPCTLSLPQVDRVRYHLYPELRVSTPTEQAGLFDTDANAMPDLIKIMDMQQEQLARSLGEGHRVIHGVAGSGKTMILAYRSIYLAKATTKPILVLCYNRSLAGRLQQMVAEHNANDKITVRNFHAWCYDMVATYHLPRPQRDADTDKTMENLVRCVMEGVEKGHVPRAQYAGILIDEGHDFQPEWFSLVVQMLDPKINALLVLYDDAQSIYRNGDKKKKFSFSSVGIQAQGRTTILRINYRNPAEVLAVARGFAHDLLTARDADDDGVPQIHPETAGRHGAYPELLRCDDAREEQRIVIARIRQEIDNGTAPADIAILYRYAWQAKHIETSLQQAGIAFISGASSEGRQRLFEDDQTVKIISMHSSKGLEFPVVFIPYLGHMPATTEDPVDEARLLYVAMTRALGRLIMTHHQVSDFSRRVQDAITHAHHWLDAPE